MGGAPSPLVWCRVVALLARLTPGLFDPSELFLLIFMEDPHCSVAGPLETRNRNIALLVLVWRTLGFPLSLGLEWIGATIVVS